MRHQGSVTASLEAIQSPLDPLETRVHLLEMHLGVSSEETASSSKTCVEPCAIRDIGVHRGHSAFRSIRTDIWSNRSEACVDVLEKRR